MIWKTESCLEIKKRRVIKVLFFMSFLLPFAANGQTESIEELNIHNQGIFEEGEKYGNKEIDEEILVELNNASIDKDFSDKTEIKRYKNNPNFVENPNIIEEKLTGTKTILECESERIPIDFIIKTKDELKDPRNYNNLLDFEYRETNKDLTGKRSTADGLLSIENKNGKVRLKYNGSLQYIESPYIIQSPLSTTSELTQLEDMPEEILTLGNIGLNNQPEIEQSIDSEIIDNCIDDGLEVNACLDTVSSKPPIIGEEHQRIASAIKIEDQDNETIIRNLESGELIESDFDMQGFSQSVEDLKASITLNEKRAEEFSNRFEELEYRLDLLELNDPSKIFSEDVVNFLGEIINQAGEGSFIIYEDIKLAGEFETENATLTNLTIRNSKEEAKVIGEAVIEPNYTPSVVMDDGSVTNENPAIEIGKDGKSVVIETSSINVNSKIFISFQDDPGSQSWVEKLKDNDGDYKGFVIKLNEPVDENVKVSWWIVEEE